MARRRRLEIQETLQWLEVDFSRPADVGKLIVVAYVRLSKKDLEKGNYSIEMQIEDILDFCADQPTWDFRGFYIDDGKSAFANNAWKRQNFNQMVSNAEAKKFDVLVIHRVSRLARNTEASLRVARELQEIGINVVIVREDADLSTPEGQQRFTDLAVEAERHSNNISRDVRRSAQYKQDHGEASWGRPPYGYQMCDDDCPYDDEHPYWHLHEVKAQLVEEMFLRYDSGHHSLTDIARWLIRNGHKTNGNATDMPGAVIEGGTFSAEAIGDILRNARYIGMVNNGRPGKGKRPGKGDRIAAADPPAVVNIPGLHKPIVSREIFESVNRRLQKNTVRRATAGRKSAVPQMLKGIVHCYICDTPYYVMQQWGKYSLKMRDSEGCVCKNQSIAIKHVERDVDLFFGEFTLEDDWKASLEEALRNEPDFQQVEEKRQKLLREKRFLNARAGIDPDLKLDEYRAKLQEIVNNIDSLESPTTEQVTEAAEYLGSFSKTWVRGSASEKNDVLHRMLDRIYFDPEARRIHSIVPRQNFAIPFRSMAERRDVELGPLSEVDLESCRKLRGIRGIAAQFTALALKIDFSHHLPLENLAERIESKRVHGFMTRAVLAERLDVSMYSITLWEKGSMPRLEFHEKLAAWLAEPLPEWTNSITLEGIGQCVKDHRLAWGLTQNELGERISVSPSAIGSCERGFKPSMQALAKLGPWLAEAPPERPPVKIVGDIELGQRIRDRRLKLGLSQMGLEQQLNVSHKTVSRWETGIINGDESTKDVFEAWLAEPITETLGSRIRANRLELGLTQADLAERFGVTTLAVRQWESEKRFPSETNRQRVIGWLSTPVRLNSAQLTDVVSLVALMKQKRQRLDISAFSMTRILGVSKNRVYDWESGATAPSEESCEKIANWLSAIEAPDRSASSVVSRWNLAGRMSEHRASSLTGRGVQLGIPSSDLGKHRGIQTLTTHSQLAERISRASGPDNGHASAGALIRREHRGLLSGLGRIGAYSSGSRETVLSESP